MSTDAIILATAWILTIMFLIVFVPRIKIREALVIFFSVQLITWLFGLAVVQYGLIEYPVRLFAHANKTSFSFEYFIYPAICVLFNLHYPNGKSRIRQLLHYFYFCSLITVVEVLCERYTHIIKYINWSWYISWITLFITMFASRQFYRWFFRLKEKQASMVNNN